MTFEDTVRRAAHAASLENAAARAVITYECRPEDLPVRGNAMASGDDAFDKQCEDAILADLEHNEWAWCRVRCVATLGSLAGEDHLGGCSYASREEFESDGYASDMAHAAREDLASKLEQVARDLGLDCEGVAR